MTAALAARLWEYQAERFPVGKSALLILVFAAACALYGARLEPGDTQPWRGVVVAAVVLFCAFFHLRVADEHKDLEDDSRYRPERPVPRGLVSLAELRALAVAGGLIQIVATLALAPRLLPLLSLIWAWMGLMTVEFFAPRWLKAHPLVYLFSHMAVMPMLALFALACGMDGWPEVGPGTLGLLTLALCNGLALELGRKAWAPSDEREGVETYSKLWGPGVTGGAVAAAIAGAVISGLAAQAAVGLFPLWFAPAVLVAAGAWAAGAAYVRRPVTANAKRLELLTGVFTLAAYLSLSILPQMIQTLAGRR